MCGRTTSERAWGAAGGAGDGRRAAPPSWVRPGNCPSARSRKLDLSKVAVAGYSLGGLTTWEAIHQDARFKVGILLDPYLANASASSTETAVLMLLTGSEQRSEGECRLWSELLGPRPSVNLRGAEHRAPSDAVWLAKGTISTGAMGPEKTVAAVRDYVATFLDANLRGRSPAPLLIGPSSDYPGAGVTTT